MIQRILRIKIIALVYIVCWGVIQGQNTAPPTTLFSVEDLKTDFVFYRTNLEKYHPNLYLYKAKPALDHLFDSLYASINQPLTEEGFYKIITLTSGAIKDGHTLILPSTSNTEYHNQQSKFLPYKLACIENKLFVEYVCTYNKTIPEGAEIVRINGIPSGDIVNQLLARQVRDGNNPSYAHWILNNYFREYYSYLFGHPEKFDIEYRIQSTLLKTTVAGLVKDSIYYYKKENYPHLSAENKFHSGITLALHIPEKYGVLTIKDFHDEVLKNEYHQSFKKTMAACFDSIFAANTETLIIDLRNNQGGDIKNGVFLLSYLLNQPFKIVNEYHCLKNKKLVHTPGPFASWQKPHKKNYQGKLYVLINGGSFSNSAIVSSCLNTHHRATFVGTETGGNPNVLAGYPKELSLPHTKIRVSIPTLQFIMTSLEQNDGRGVQPHHVIDSQISDRLLLIDTELNEVLKLIKK